MTARRLRPCAALLLLLLSGAAAAQSMAAPAEPRPADPGGLDAQQDQRYRHLVHELRCVVCQNQSIAESNAPLAQDLRDQVRNQLAAGRSDAEIRDYLTARYGDFVLYRPRLRAGTLLLWFGPALLLVGALLAAVRHSRRRAATAAVAAPVDEQALQRLLDRHSR